jgi:hypothetical protein
MEVLDADDVEELWEVVDGDEGVTTGSDPKGAWKLEHRGQGSTSLGLHVKERKSECGLRVAVTNMSGR